MRTPTGRLPSQPNMQRIPAALTPGDHSLVNQLRASALLDHLDPLIAHLNDTGEATLTGDRFTLTIKRVP